MSTAVLPSLSSADACIELGREAQRGGDTPAARRHYEEALRALDPGDYEVACRVLRWISWTHSIDGNSSAALDCLTVAENVAEVTGDKRALASVLNTRAGVLFEVGRLDEAEALFERVRQKGVLLGDDKLVAMADQNLGSVLAIRGDAVRALGCFKSSFAAYRSLGETSYLGPLMNNIGRLQLDLNEDLEAGESLEVARGFCESERDFHHLVIVDVNRAWVRLREGDPETALSMAQGALETATLNGDDRWFAEIHHVSATAHHELGRFERALNLFSAAIDLATEREDPKILAHLLLEKARTLRSVGRNRETLDCLNRARGLFRTLRARRDLESVRCDLNELERAFLDIVVEWGQSIEDKDAYTQGHCGRVAEYACRLASAAGFPMAEMEWFRMGALLHDVGKVAVPSEVLNKPGRLDDEEWAIMARHPALGVEMLGEIEFPWDVKPMIRHHHERWDGTGYPDLLQGTDIPLEARILTIADIYDALTTTRSYRPGYSPERAVAILRSEMGQAVDPTLCEIFISRVVPTIEHREPAPLALAV